MFRSGGGGGGRSRRPALLRPSFAVGVGAVVVGGGFVSENYCEGVEILERDC